MPQCFSTDRVKARRISMFCWMRREVCSSWRSWGFRFVVGVGVWIAVGVEAVVFGGVEGPGGVEAEVYADVAVLFVAGVFEVGAEADDADGAGFEAPEGVELGLGGCGGGDVGCPECPAHLELDGHVVVEVLGGFGDGVFDDGTLGVGVFLGAGVVDVEALVGGGLGEGDGIDGGGGYALGSGVAPGLRLQRRGLTGGGRR